MDTWTSTHVTNLNMQEATRELSDTELAMISGGVLPVIGFGIALASHVGVGGAATTFTGHFLTAVGLGLATYGLANYWGGGKTRMRKTTAK